ncbi:alpha/beta hydrolase [Comamonas guangdongensis]|uniref:Alpha/beta hydrolase n=1 Tax=Comamonas guangdongensis TaxID=510515 RepID=A0ABV3ZV65_9BURK
MQIHPELAALLEQFKDAPAMDFNTMPMPEIRKLMDHMELPPGDLPMHELRELRIPVAEHSVAARLYRPTADRAAPVMLFFHGGGWCFGTMDTHDNLCRHLARITGMNVVSVDYRLAPEHVFPAALDDAYAATRWVAAHASELCCDAGQLCVAGDSAGGNLAIATCLRAKQDGWNGIRQQLLFYPVCDAGMDAPSHALYGQMPFLTRDGMAAMWRHYHPVTPVHTLASVMQHPDVAGLPPAVLVTAELDILRDEGEAFARRLQQAGVRVSTLRAEGMLHGFANFSTLVPAVAALVEEACARLQTAPRTARA